MALSSADLAAIVEAALPASKAREVCNAAQAAIAVEASTMPDVLRFLRDEKGLDFNLFIDATAVDYEPSRGEIEVIYTLRSLVDPKRCICVKAGLDAADPKIPTSSGVFAGANWAEREILDMFGVVFEGHPDPRRILMYPEFEGHPLRKSYPYQKRQPLVPERDPLENPWPRRY